jgi:hypothetical protein
LDKSQTYEQMLLLAMAYNMSCTIVTCPNYSFKGIISSINCLY